MRTATGEIVLRDDVPRSFRLSPGEGAIFDAQPLRAAKALEGVHGRVIVEVGNQQICVDGALIQMRGVAIVIRPSATINEILEMPSVTSTG